MRILYGFSNCSDKKYNQIFQNLDISVLRPDQKYHGLLIKGLAKNGVQVRCFSGLPINRCVTKKLFVFEKDEAEDGAYYHYYKTVNLPVLRQLGIFLGGFFGVLKQKREDAYIISDILNIANSYGMLLAAKIKRIPSVLIVTDLPEFQSGGSIQKINNLLFKKADGFIFLTEQMNEKVNLLRKPYIVLEGHSDGSLDEISPDEKYEVQGGKRIVIYAGSIKRLYGIQNLVEGFIKADIENSELHIYGDGDYKDELKEIANKRVKYMGICPNEEVIFEEQRAALLVNPRPSAPEYTKYSFPSKNMEYMVSGTPVMTTKLPGMPGEYLPYVYIIENETADGISESLKTFFDDSIEKRHQMGKNAREFVLNNKSNFAQAKRIIEFLKKEIKEYED